MKIEHAITTLLAAASLTLGAHTAFAEGEYQQAPQTQSQPPQAQTPQEQAPAQAATDIDEATLDKFVSAYTEVQEIHQEYSERLQNVEDAEEATSLQQEAQEKMQDAVTSNGLSIGEYEQVANEVREDPELRDRVTREILQSMES